MKHVFFVSCKEPTEKRGSRVPNFESAVPKLKSKGPFFFLAEIG